MQSHPPGFFARAIDHVMGHSDTPDPSTGAGRMPAPPVSKSDNPESSVRAMPPQGPATSPAAIRPAAGPGRAPGGTRGEEGREKGEEGGARGEGRLAEIAAKNGNGNGNGQVLGAGVRPIGEPVKRYTLTLEFLVAEWTASDRSSARWIIRLGAFAHRWVSRQTDRAAGIAQIRAALQAAGVSGEKCRVDRYIAVYWVAQRFGFHGDGATVEGAETLTASTLRLFIPLLRRDRLTEEWHVRERYEAQAKALWARAIGEKLTSTAVAQAIGEIRPRRRRPVRARNALARLLRRIGQLDGQQVEAVSEALEARRQRLAASPIGEPVAA